jgi:cytochrome P450
MLTQSSALRYFLASLPSPVRESEAKKSDYLQVVIKEGLRMWPPIRTMTFIHAQSGDTITGVYIPEGTKVGVCWYVISRSKSSYGEDANVFRPGRWLEAGDEFGPMERTNDLIFAPSKWGCLGKSLAFAVLNKVFPGCRGQ